MQKRSQPTRIRRVKRGAHDGGENPTRSNYKSFTRASKECQSFDDVVYELYKLMKHNLAILKKDGSFSMLDFERFDIDMFSSVVGVDVSASKMVRMYACALQRSTLTVTFNVFKSIFKLCLDLVKLADLDIEDCKNIGSTFAVIALTNYLATDVLAKGLKVFEEIVCAVPPESELLECLLDPLIGSEGAICSWKYSLDRELCNAAINFYRSILDPKNLAILKVAYNYVFKSLQECRKTLETMVSGNFNYRRVQEAEVFMTVLFGALKSIVEVKNSLNIIGLQPTLFQLLVHDMPLSCEWFIRYFSNVHYSLLVTAKMHFVSREFFVANSQLIRNSSLPESAIQNNLSLIFTRLATLLNSKYLNDDSRRLIIQMLFKLVSDITADQLRLILEIPEVRKTRKAVLDCFLSHGLNFHADCGALSIDGKNDVTVMKKLAVFVLIDSDFDRSANFIEDCIVKSRDKPLEYAVEVWRTIPPSLFIKNAFRSFTATALERQQYVAQRSMNDSRLFVTVTGLLFDSIVPKCAANHFDIGDTHWLSYLASDLHAATCHGQENRELANLDSTSKWRWIITKVASFCIENRMKTPFGKPQDTFAKFEGAVRMLANTLAKRDNSITPRYRPRPLKMENKAVVARKKATAPDEDVDFREVGEVRERLSEPLLLSPAEDWWRVRMLLELIETLDKLMKTAFDGSVVNLMDASYECRKFFDANKGTCSTWVSRMSIPLLSVSFHNGYYAQTIRIGANVLGDLERRLSIDSPTDNIENAAFTVVGWMIRAMIELGDDQSIQGIRKWIFVFLKKEATWIESAEKMARGEIEQAICEFTMLLNHNGGAPHVAKTAIREMLLKALRYGRNPDKINSSWEVLTSEMDNSFQSQCIRVKALTEWEPSGCVSQDILQSPIGWDISEKMDDFESRLLLLSSRVRNGTPHSHLRSEVGDLVFDLAEEARIVFNVDSLQHISRASVIHQKLRFFHQKVNLDKNRLKNGFANDAKLNPFYEFDPEDVLMKGMNEAKLHVTKRLSVAQELAVFIEPSFDQMTTDVRYSDFYLTASRLARKTGNLTMAKKHLDNLFSSSHSPFSSPYPWPQYSESIVNGLVPPAMTAEEYLLKNLKVLKHAIKMEYSMETDKAVPGVLRQFDTHCRAFSLLAKVVGNYVERRVLENNVARSTKPFIPEFDVIADSLHFQFSHLAENKSSDHVQKHYADVMEMNKIVSKACLRLGVWVKTDPGMYNTLYPQFCGTFWHQALLHHNHIRACSGLNGAESLVGALFTMSTRIAPMLSKCHKTLGDWAIAQVLQSDPEVSASTTLLNNEERTLMRGYLTCDAQESEVRSEVLRIISSSVNQTEYFQNLNDYASRASQGVSDVLNESQVLLSQLWVASNERRNFLYDVALRAYFSYLGSGDPNAKAIDNISAALQILQIMTNYHESFLPVIQENLLRLRDDVWKEILPQIFAHLNHSSSEVRQTLVELLGRIAFSSPHSVCYQAVVGANQFDENENEEKQTRIIKFGEEAAADISQDQEDDFVPDCCRRLLATISQSRPKLVADLKVFVSELQRINMLGEERWIIALSNLDHEVMRRTKQVMREVAKANTFEELTAAEKFQLLKPKWKVLTEPLYQILNDLYERTCSFPQTPNEKLFVKQHADTVRVALKQFHKNRLDLPSAWRPFKQFLDILNHRQSKRSAMQLMMQDISPSLSEMGKTAVPIPGQEGMPFENVVSIHKMGDKISILPTKTRPKKLAFIGSDGKEYTFLFKGQEDLHLDERLMQFLRICNKMLHPLDRSDDYWPAYYNTNYSVTPLGCRSGLIQWVEGGTPIYQMYRKYKNRQAIWKRGLVKEKRGMIKVQKTTNDDGKDNPRLGSGPKKVLLSLTENERPTDIFARKLKAVMAEQKIPYTSDRTKWTKEILGEVLKRLITDTPRDLLSREMWMRSGNSETWWRVTQRFSRSSAVMSIIGYIIGLGDRHLDNILVNLSTGNVVHIDYNVCFEKGRNLRVPETVPFRLTGNIAHALGPTNIEGTFRESCVHVMQTLREGKSTLLAILDAFVYDPLVDWTAQDSVVSSSAVNFATMLAVYGNSRKATKTSSIHRESNKHARNIARLVRLKLEGYNATTHQFDEEDVQPLQAREQIDALIEEATDPLNLSLMYEGWTSWV